MHNVSSMAYVILQILKNVLNIRHSLLVKVKDEILVLYCDSWELTNAWTTNPTKYVSLNPTKFLQELFNEFIYLFGIDSSIAV